MINVRCQRSDEDTATTLSQHKPTYEGLKRAVQSYHWWDERWEKVYPTKSVTMRLWMDYKGTPLDIARVHREIDLEFGEWAHISRILDKIQAS